MRRFVVSICTLLAVCSGAPAQAAPRLTTNETYVKDVTARSDLAIDDPMAVFAYVLEGLATEVTVYPTENHYYFAFVFNGTRYAGNIKIDAQLRTEGKIAFTYYEDRPRWLEDTRGTDLVLGAAQGVTVQKVAPLLYRVTYKNKRVAFALNDLSQVKPPPVALAPEERFIGPIFDDSAVRFFLVFNPELKLFHYVLDETIRPADTFVPAPVGDGRILIGKRTGFAVYRDKRRDRRILIGVYRGNVVANNYLDGPFDQMPDNFIEDDRFRQAIVDIEPALKGLINRYGGFSDGARFAVVPYMEYDTPQDLDIFDRCATDPGIPEPAYGACLSLPLAGRHGPGTQPLAMTPYPR